MTVEEVRGSLDLTDNGAIKNSIRNCLTVFQNDPVLQGAVRYNILTERIKGYGQGAERIAKAVYAGGHESRTDSVFS